MQTGGNGVLGGRAQVAWLGRVLSSSGWKVRQRSMSNSRPPPGGERGGGGGWSGGRRPGGGGGGDGSSWGAPKVPGGFPQRMDRKADFADQTKLVGSAAGQKMAERPSTLPYKGGAGGGEGGISRSVHPSMLKEMPAVELSPDEQALRQQLLNSATLTETVKGMDELIKETGAAMARQRPMQFEEVAPAQPQDPVPLTPEEEAVKRAQLEAEAAAQAERVEKAKKERENAFRFKGKPTPLLEELSPRLQMGPIPVNEYMQQALAHPKHGYYMQRDVFGTKGDFVTAPEVSQIFGELMGIWVVWVWEALGSPKKVQLVELGPGRGTMMADMLRAIGKFRPLVGGLSVEMVETSPALREAQRKKLSKGSTAGSSEVHHDGTGIMVRWRDTLGDVPLNKDVPCIMIAQEFLDCMPVKQFQYTELGWCERLVELDPTKEGPHHLRYVLSKGPTPPAQVLLNKELVPGIPRVPEMNQGVEVSSEAFQVAQEIGRRVSITGGAALMIDYGNNGPSVDSLQAIKKHKKVHVLESPGECDVTAHVDFSAIRKAALDGSTVDASMAAAAAALAAAGSSERGDAGGNRESPRQAALRVVEEVKQGNKAALEAHGPTTQCDFLHAMGIRERAGQILESASASQAKRLEEEYTRLCSPDEMGTLFKVLAITPATIPVGTAAGFPPGSEVETTYSTTEENQPGVPQLDPNAFPEGVPKVDNGLPAGAPQCAVDRRQLAEAIVKKNQQQSEEKSSSDGTGPAGSSAGGQ